VAVTNGTVALVSGQLIFTPAANYNGPASFTYTITDGTTSEVGTVSGVVTPENDPVPLTEADEPSPVPTPDRPVSDVMTVDGMVLDIIDSLQELGGIANLIGDKGVIVSTVNALSFLGSVEGLVASNEAIGAERISQAQIWEMRQIADRLGFGHLLGASDTEGTKGFSLYLNMFDKRSGGGLADQLVVNTLIRDRMLIVQLSSALADTNRSVQEYRVLQGNGEPLPTWLKRASHDMLIGEHPADTQVITLRIKILYDDGTVETRSVEIRTDTGEIQPVAIQDARVVVPFSSQFASIQPQSEAEIYELAQIVRAS
jgi:hypothetical protein